MQNFNLTLEEIRASKSQIESEFKTLLLNKRIIPRSNKKQWQFFDCCFNLLFGIETGFVCSAENAVTYAHEVNKRLKKFKNQKSVQEFKFYLIHEKKLSPELVEYPASNGYALIVSNRREIEERLELLHKIIDEAVEKEFKIYKTIPTTDLAAELSELKTIYDENGSAYRDILKTVENRRQQGHTIQFPAQNPSSKQLRDTAVVKHSNTEATVEAKLYMYLKWWSIKDNDYVNPSYREELIVTYTLKQVNDRWLVSDMRYPEKNPKKLKP